MARMRKIASKLGSSKPVVWLKKHWLKVVIAIVVVYAIYWLFFQDMDLEHATSATPAATPTLDDLKKAMDDAKAAWDAALAAEKTYTGDCNSIAVTPSTTSGCPAYTNGKKIKYDEAKKAYEDALPKKKKSKKVPSFRSRTRSFFSGIGKSFKRSTDKTKRQFKKAGDSIESTFSAGSIEQGVGMRW